MSEEKKYNVKLGKGFSHKSFGEGSVLIDLTPELIQTFAENAQVGGKILVRYNTVTTYGNHQYWVELLPPVDKTKKFQGKGAVPTSGRAPSKKPISELD